MNNQSHAFKAGLFVVILSVVVIIATLWIGGEHGAEKPYIVVTSRNVFGLKAQSTVFFRGMTAGTVRKIGLNPLNTGQIFIYIAINHHIPITQGTYALLKFQGVTGLTALELDTTQNMRPLNTSRAHPAHIPMHASLLETLSQAGTTTIKHLNALTRALQQVLNTTNRQHISAILANTAHASRQWTRIGQQLSQATATLPTILQQTNTTLKHINGLATELTTVGAQLGRLTQTAQGASEQVLGRTLPKINRAIDQLTSASADVQRLSRSLRHHPRELLLGARTLPPGPGEPGYTGATP